MACRSLSPRDNKAPALLSGDFLSVGRYGNAFVYIMAGDHSTPSAAIKIQILHVGLQRHRDSYLMHNTRPEPDCSFYGFK